MNKFGIGQPVRRVEDQRFTTGRGRYVDDITLPRQAHAAVVLSPHAHARIRRIDVSATGLFRERGYHGTSMRTLAGALGMETASLYYHFPSTQEILFAILDRTLDDLLERAVAAADGHGERSGRPCAFTCSSTRTAARKPF